MSTKSWELYFVDPYLIDPYLFWLRARQDEPVFYGPKLVDWVHMYGNVQNVLQGKRIVNF